MFINSIKLSPQNIIIIKITSGILSYYGRIFGDIILSKRLCTPIFLLIANYYL